MSYEALALRVRVGSSIDTLRPVAVNDDQHPTHLTTDDFDGYISVRVRGVSSDSLYFEQSSDKFCIQVVGRFLHPCTADDIVFGNQFDRPLQLPYGTSIGVRFLKWIDPGLVCDLYAAQPYAFSPLIVTMNRLAIKQSELLSWPSPNGEPVEEDIELLSNNVELPKDRKTFFNVAENRKAIPINGSQVWSMDFCNPYIDASNHALKIPGLSMDMLQYWDGQVNYTF
ncbi:hypothetical protein DFQ29_005692 [Apophysomyces sp. BC1021]|nr:hypothetical protein DFQ29_005692 [Apophysomyces sp. BC1021]